MALSRTGGWILLLLLSFPLITPANGNASGQASSQPLVAIPGKLTWKNPPVASHVTGGKELTIRTGPKTDWFVDPFGGRSDATAPILLFMPASSYVLNAKVKIGFKAKWDAGALMIWSDDHHWAKLLLEMSAEGHPNIVSVVTRGLSDDCNSILISGDTVYLQIARSGQTYVFYASTDGTTWHIIRSFVLDTDGAHDGVGFETQSPVGAGAEAVFSDIHYTPKKIANIYTGK